MSTIKTTPDRLAKLLIVLALVVGSFALGVLLNDFPHLTFDTQVGVGDLISVAGLLVAAIIIPFVINKYFSNKENTGQVLVADMDTAIKKVAKVADMYREVHFSGKILKQDQYKILLFYTKSLTNILQTITDELDNHSSLRLFREEVFDQYSSIYLTDFTEHLVVGSKVNYEVFLNVNRSVDLLETQLRKYRYKVFNT